MNPIRVGLRPHDWFLKREVPAVRPFLLGFAMRKPEFKPDNMVMSFNRNRAHGRPWTTVGDHTYDDGTTTITIQEGFSTDLASIPDSLAWLYCPNGRHQVAAVFHDYLYFTKQTTRYQADAIFRVIMEHCGVKKWRVLSIYFAVRLFGWIAWRDNGGGAKQ